MAVEVQRNIEKPVQSQPGKFNGRLRRHSEQLSKLDLPNDNHKNHLFQRILSPAVTEEETRNEGKALLGKFLLDEFEIARIETPEEIKAEFEHLCTPKGYADPYWATVGRELRRCADDFQKSVERRKVKNQADQVAKDSEAVTKSQFADLLTELLSQGITKERIVVLFFFCADVAIATLKSSIKERLRLCQQFVRWSLEFIVGRVCSWVQEHGGWGAVFSSTVMAVFKVATFIGLGLLCYFGVKKLVGSKTIGD